MIAITDAISLGAALLTAARLLLFTRGQGTHRPWASLLAYGLIVACAALGTMLATGHAAGTSWPQTLINVVLALAVASTGGNMVELFRPAGSNRQPLVLRLLRKESWIR